MSLFQHGYSFDPSYGHSLQSLLEVLPPPEGGDFAPFWLARLARALQVAPRPALSGRWQGPPGFVGCDIVYESTDGFRIGGWLLTPAAGEVRRALVIGHGYGGRDGPDGELPLADAAYLFPCFRGLSRSRRHDVSDNPAFHVLHDIDKPQRYLIGGCVEDVWVGVSVLLELFPQVEGRIGYQGTSFGGGIGAMALAWDGRIGRGALSVPTFGHQSLRLALPTTGSGDAVSRFERQRGRVMDTLQYYDAALSARHITIPVHVAAALFDPVVAPPGQFAIYNALAGPRYLYVLDGGHFDYPRRTEQEARLFQEMQRFFDAL
ncbi:MAG: acetylxylan esterase [Candidatus Methylumidiphilus sp.]